MEAWHYWLIAAVVLGILEMFSGNFVLASLAATCVACAAGAAVGFGAIGQLSVFVVAGFAVVFGVRPVAMRYLFNSGECLKSNADGMVGMDGVIVEDVPEHGVGRILVGSETWRAVGDGREFIGSGAQVVVVGIDGATLTVKQQTKGSDLGKPTIEERNN